MLLGRFELMFKGELIVGEFIDGGMVGVGVGVGVVDGNIKGLSTGGNKFRISVVSNGEMSCAST